MRPLKIFLTLTALALVLPLAGFADVGTYNRVDSTLDWGATTTKLIVDMGEDVSGEVSPNSFTILAMCQLLLDI